jgi:hypothetical protein
MDQLTAYRASGPRTGERVRFWREQRLDNLECLEARFRTHRYTPHVHETFAIGVIVSGVEIFRCRGARHRAAPGHPVPDAGWRKAVPVTSLPARAASAHGQSAASCGCTGCDHRQSIIRARGRSG